MVASMARDLMRGMERGPVSIEAPELPGRFSGGTSSFDGAARRGTMTVTNTDLPSFLTAHAQPVSGSVPMKSRSSHEIRTSSTDRALHR